MIAAVVLAAGSSSRLGRPKQLLDHHGRPLLRHAVDCAAAAGCDPVIVVLGSRADELRPALEGTTARLVVNRDWPQGMGSSVRAGVAAVQGRQSEVRAVLLMTCDQPKITPEVVRALCRRFAAARTRLVACSYAGTVGVPALFERSLFPELLGLSGSGGAKAVLQAHAEELTLHPWPDGAIDVDTPESWDSLDAD